MKVVIIEDEKLSADYLQTVLLKIDPTIQVVQTIDTVKKSIAFLESNKSIDLLFVDIHLADGISFEIFQSISVSIPIIFTTAYDEYAIKAFKLNSIDYLLKPISKDELSQAIAKYKQFQSNSNQDQVSKLEELLTAFSKPIKNRFLVKIGDQLLPIKTEEISLFKHEEGIVFLVNKANKEYPIDFSLDQLEACVDNKQFFRINRKVLISIDAIEKISSYFNSRLKIKHPQLSDEMSIISRERVSDFKKWMEGDG
jgi:DNA-binding LytR/AlgR family response regulator